LKRFLGLLFACIVTHAASAEEADLSRKSIETQNFRLRCEGAFFCQGFDESVPVGTRKDEGIAVGSLDNPSNRRPTVQNGFLRTHVLSGSGAGGGGFYFIDFAKRMGIKIGAGEAIFIQWRQYMPEAFVRTAFVQMNGKWTKPKQMILSQDGASSRNSSCTTNHFVVTGQNWKDYPGRRTIRLYNRCRPAQLIELRGPRGSRLWDTQPIGSIGPSVARKCWRGNIDTCWEYPTDKWVTYQLGLTVSPLSYVHKRSGRTVWDTRVQLWAQEDGKPAELVVDTVHPTSAVNLGWGRVWLLPYMTGKDPAQVHPDTYTDYDELIISRQRIPDPY
jgi:hypothetical protein